MPFTLDKRLLAIAISILTSTVLTAGDDRPEALRVATWNVEWFFDDFKPDNREELAKQNSAPSREEWDWKLNQVARVIASLEPTILALQEVENRDVIYRLTKVLEEQHQLKYRYAFIDGFDFGTEQDVALLYTNGLIEYSRREQTQEMFDSKQYYNIGKHIFGRFEWGTGADVERVTILTAHFRAMPEQEELRKRQGRLVHDWLKSSLANGENVIVLGDFNSEHRADDPKPESDLGVMCGWSTAANDDDLIDLHTNLPTDLRNTHLIGREYDRILVSRAMNDDDPNRTDLVFNRIVNRKDLVIVGEQDADHFNLYYQIPQAERDVSDHYPIMAEFIFK